MLLGRASDDRDTMAGPMASGGAAGGSGRSHPGGRIGTLSDLGDALHILKVCNEVAGLLARQAGEDHTPALLDEQQLIEGLCNSTSGILFRFGIGHNMGMQRHVPQYLLMQT